MACTVKTVLLVCVVYAVYVDYPNVNEAILEELLLEMHWVMLPEMVLQNVLQSVANDYCHVQTCRSADSHMNFSDTCDVVVCVLSLHSHCLVRLLSDEAENLISVSWHCVRGILNDAVAYGIDGGLCAVVHVSLRLSHNTPLDRVSIRRQNPFLLNTINLRRL